MASEGINYVNLQIKNFKYNFKPRSQESGQEISVNNLDEDRSEDGDLHDLEKELLQQKQNNL